MLLDSSQSYYCVVQLSCTLCIPIHPKLNGPGLVNESLILLEGMFAFCISLLYEILLNLILFDAGTRSQRLPRQ